MLLLGSPLLSLLESSTGPHVSLSRPYADQLKLTRNFERYASITKNPEHTFAGERTPETRYFERYEQTRKLQLQLLCGSADDKRAQRPRLHVVRDDASSGCGENQTSGLYGAGGTYSALLTRRGLYGADGTPRPLR